MERERESERRERNGTGKGGHVPPRYTQTHNDDVEERARERVPSPPNLSICLFPFHAQTPLIYGPTHMYAYARE